MLDKIFLVLLGFLLTTLGGGLIGTLLQHRAWRHRWEVEHAEKRSEISTQVFEEISKLMDRRLFRADQLQLWLSRDDKEKVNNALQDYRQVLFDWNDSINRHLSMLQIYFGTQIREDFDFRVGRSFVDVGGRVEDLYRRWSSKQSIAGEPLDDVRNRLERLRGQVYNYNLKLLGSIEAAREAIAPRLSLVEDIKALFVRKRI